MVPNMNLILLGQRCFPIQTFPLHILVAKKYQLRIIESNVCVGSMIILVNPQQHTLTSNQRPNCCSTLMSAARSGPRCAAVVGGGVVDGTDPAGAEQSLGILSNSSERGCAPLNQLSDSSDDDSISFSLCCSGSAASKPPGCDALVSL